MTWNRLVESVKFSIEHGECLASSGCVDGACGKTVTANKFSLPHTARLIHTVKNVVAAKRQVSAQLL